MQLLQLQLRPLSPAASLPWMRQPLQSWGAAIPGWVQFVFHGCMHLCGHARCQGCGAASHVQVSGQGRAFLVATQITIATTNNEPHCLEPSVSLLFLRMF